MKEQTVLVNREIDASVISKILLVRGHKVLLDRELSELYGVETRILKRAVKRNSDRFPNDFMFELTKKEMELMVSQIGIPSKSYFGGANPMVFTEQGVAMLSSVLKSQKAVAINIAIMRTFVQLRRIFESNNELAEKFIVLKDKHDKKDGLLRNIYDVIDQMIHEEEPEERKLGFKVD